MTDSRTDSVTVPYRCVCGETVQLDTQAGGECPSCGRHYSAEALQGSMSMTVGMPSDVGRDESDDEMIGHALDHFTIIDRLGGGGMGTVYRALDESLQRYVAIKVIRRGARGVNETQHLERLLQEARAQARVNHRNVVHIYYVGRDEQQPYLAMELVGGTTLARQMQTPLSYREVVSIGLQVLRALQQSARFDIIHGDIKPGNILLDGETVKLSDFGLSQRISEVDATEGTVAGTPNYMAPEVCAGRPADIRSDQYSLGVMLFEMTFARLPYRLESSTIESRLEAHRFAPVEYPAPWPAEVPEAWRELLERLLAKDPAERFDTYEELVTEVEQLRPLDHRQAGRLVRLLAWLIDLILLGSLQGIILIPIGLTTSTGQLETYLSDRPWIGVGCALLSGVVPLAAGWWQASRGTTPGKRLMQIRIVNAHGLRPSRRTLALRSVLQYLPLWVSVPKNAIAALGIEDLSRGLTVRSLMTPNGALIMSILLLTLLSYGWVAIDSLFAVVRKSRCALHDTFFKTRVVLDSQSTRPEH